MKWTRRRCQVAHSTLVKAALMSGWASKTTSFTRATAPRELAQELGPNRLGEPRTWPVAFDRPIQEGIDLAVDLRPQPANLALGDAAHAHGFDHGVAT